MIQPLSAPLPRWPAVVSEPPLPHTARAELTQAISVSLTEARSPGPLKLELPLSAITPTLTPSRARTLTAARLLAPWCGRSGQVELRVEGQVVQLFAAEIRPRAWLAAPARFELLSHSGERCLLEVHARALAIDFTAREQQAVRDEIFSCRRALAEAKRVFEDAEAVLKDPEHRLAEKQRDAFGRASTALGEVQASLAVRRAEVRAEMSLARAAVWALAAELPGTSSVNAELRALSTPLLSLANQQSYVKERMAELRQRIGALENDPALTPAVRQLATRESKAQLSDKELTIAVLNADIAERIGDIQRKAQEAGLEDALLARGDFLLGAYPQSGIEGSFEYLLEAERKLRGEVEERERDCVAYVALGLVEVKQRAEQYAKACASLEARLSSLVTQLHWLERATVSHPIATRYAS